MIYIGLLFIKMEVEGHKKARKIQLNDFQKGQVVAYISSGVSMRKISRLFNVSCSTISMLKRKYDENGNCDRVPGSGRPSKMPPRFAIEATIAIKRDRRVSAVRIGQILGVENVSVRSIRRYINANTQFSSYWSAKTPFICDRNRKLRILWAKEHLGWTIEDWRAVLWSDESPFVLRSGVRFRVWRRHNERYAPWCTKGTVKHDQKLMVWGCFCANGVGMLHRINGIMDQHVYLDILENCLLPSVDMLFEADEEGDNDVMFQQDNDPKHTARLVQGWLTDNVNLIDWWPAQSPDLNPIENLWSILDQRLKDRVPNNKDELFEVLLKAWRELPNELLTNLVESMPRRCQAVINAKGYATKY